jgi:hypothetical protein
LKRVLALEKVDMLANLEVRAKYNPREERTCPRAYCITGGASRATGIRPCTP